MSKGKIIGYALLGMFPHTNGVPDFDKAAVKFDTTKRAVEEAYNDANGATFSKGSIQGS